MTFADSQGLTVTSVSTSDVITQTTQPSTVYWIINGQLNGGGQSLTGTVDPSMVKNFMGGKVYTSQPLNIQITSQNEQVSYDILNEGVPIYEYTVQSFNAPTGFLNVITDDPQPCPSPTNTWNIPIGQSLFGHAKVRYCVTRQQVATKGSYSNPTVGFSAVIQASAGDISKQKTICSGSAPGCEGSSVAFDDLGTATWTGSLVTGDAAPNQDNFVAIHKTDTNQWQIVPKSLYDAYLPAPNVAEAGLNQLVNRYSGSSDIAAANRDIVNYITPANQAAQTLLAQDASFTSEPFTKDANTGKVSVTLARTLTSPNIVFRIRADWIGIVIPSGTPKILSVQSQKFTSGEAGSVAIQVQNVGDGQGTFSAMLQNCDPFSQDASAQTSRKTLQPGDIDTISIPVASGTISDNIVKNCNVLVYDVNNPASATSASVTLQLQKAKICSPGQMTVAGNTIQKCNSDGTAMDTVQQCGYAVGTDNQGNPTCVNPPQIQQDIAPPQPTQPTISCKTASDCPAYSVCNPTTSTCDLCSDIHCCQTGTLWLDSQNSCVSPTQFVSIPHDTTCQAGWPNKQGSIVTINEPNHVCDLFEVTNPHILALASEAATCYENNCAGSCNSYCNQAMAESGASTTKTAATFKTFAAYYLIYGLGPANEFMHGYFEPKINCENTGVCGPMTSEFNSYAQQLQCKGAVGQPIGWASDTDMSQNSCVISDLPAHVDLNILQTGMCVDYSVSLTTLLRMVGYTKDEVYSVSAPGHEYNLVKFPLNSQWEIVDTVGNAAQPFGDTWHWGPNSGITHCDYYSDSCANDAGATTCPAKQDVIGC